MPLLVLFCFSGTVEIESMMSVDAFVTKGGLKMLSTLHSSTGACGKIEIHVFSFQPWIIIYACFMLFQWSSGDRVYDEC